MLPRELIWVYLVAPVLVTPVIIDDLFDKPAANIVRELLASYVPFLLIPLALHALYRYAMPRLLPRIPRRAVRVLVQWAAITAIAAASAYLLIPLYRMISGRGASLRGFVINCIVIAWVTMLPALVFQRLRRHARQVERRAQEERRAALEAQLQALQARTNPHFLFNSINTVASLIPDDPVLAERTLERLADIFRYALDSSKQRFVPLARELELVRDYLEIQAVRFGARLRFEIDAPTDALAHQVPPLVLQPVVENAVLHGIADRARGGQIWIRARDAGAALELAVSDDGPGPGASTHAGTGTSMRELRERLQLVYGPAAQLAIEPRPEGGCTVRITIPTGAV